MGGATAVFNLIHFAVMNPLPFPHARRLLALGGLPGHLRAWQVPAFEHMARMGNTEVIVRREIIPGQTAAAIAPARRDACEAPPSRRLPAGGMSRRLASRT